MKSKINLLLIIFVALISQAAISQKKTVTGTVTDDAGMPLPGVNVLLRGTSNGTQTDFDGNFSISAATGDVLVFSFLGQKTTQKTVDATSVVNVSMQEDAAQLDEVVVVGYGTQSKRNLTGNVAKISADDIKEVSNPNFQNAMVAKAAGVQITQTNGKAEGGINIRVRGNASISGNSQPLYVLDGIPLLDPIDGNGDVGNGAPTNPLLTLSANEIESIDILKDASSAAIYGARGANGVVIITTKKGRQGKATFSVNLAQGFSQPTNKREFLNAAEYVELFREAAINSDELEFTEDTFDFYGGDTDWRTLETNSDWQEEAFQDGYTTDADLSMSGGDAKTSYFFSGAYNNTKVIVRGSDLERITSRMNVSHQLTDNFKAGMNLSFSRTEIDRIANDNQFATPMQAIAQSPLAPVRNPDGTPNQNTEYGNFLLDDENAFFKTIIRRTIGKFFGEYTFIPGLKFNSDFSYDLYAQTEDNFRGLNSLFQSTSGSSSATDLNSENYIFSNYATFDKTFKDVHTLNVVAGTEFNKINRRITSVTSILFPTDALPTVSSGAEVISGTGIERKSIFVSYFARATYAFDNKYLFNASIRTDGSSRFGANQRFGTFPAFSAGWVLSEEDFLNSSEKVSFLKLRGSWGQLGNAEIGDYPSRYLFSSVSYNKRGGLAPIQPANDNLTWEKTTQVNLGVEFGFLNGVISGEIDYYKKSTDDLLFALPLPLSSGETSINTNLGSLKNEGIEFVINTNNITTDNLSWTSSFNIAKNENTITSLANSNADVITADNINRVGENLASFYLIEYAGVDSANGDALFFLNTTNADGSVNRNTTNDPNEAQRIVAGNPFAEWIGGLTNNINYKNIDFSFTLQGEWGASIFNDGGRFMSANADYFDNQTGDQLNRWQQPGDITNVPQARLFGANGTAQSTRYLDGASFVRLRNVSLGYSIPKAAIERSGLSKARVYITGLNLLTFTKYSGMDPEARADYLGPARPGNEFYSVPPAKTVTIGVNLNF